MGRPSIIALTISLGGNAAAPPRVYPEKTGIRVNFMNSRTSGGFLYNKRLYDGKMQACAARDDLPRNVSEFMQSVTEGDAMFTSWKRPAITGFVVLVLCGFSSTAHACLWGLFGHWGSYGCGWSGCGYDYGCGGCGYGWGGYGYSGYYGYGSGCGCYAGSTYYTPGYVTGGVATVNVASYAVAPTCCAPSAVQLTPVVAVHNAGPTCCAVELASYTTRAAAAQSERELARGVVTVHAVYRTVKTETPAQLASDSDNFSRTLQFCQNLRRWNLR